jgi:magnesium transporter
VPYPGYAKFWGFILSTVLTVVISIGLYITFRRRDWL